jgi:hypothetical protein
MSETNWRLRELQLNATAHRETEVYRQLEYPNESAGWMQRQLQVPARARRASPVRAALAWVGLLIGGPRAPKAR